MQEIRLAIPCLQRVRILEFFGHLQRRLSWGFSPQDLGGQQTPESVYGSLSVSSTANGWSRGDALYRMCSRSLMYGRNAGGIRTLPSACWKFSITAIMVLPIANPDPFSV